MTNDFFFKEFENQIIIKKKTNKKEFIIFDKALWESKILKKNSGKITKLRFSKKETGKQLLSNLIKYLKKKNYFWIQLDSKNIFTKEKNFKTFLLDQNFEISNEYIQWKLKKNNINNELLNLVSKKIKFQLAKKKDLKKLQKFTERYPDPGRFVLKQKFRKYGIKLYKSWVSNSLLEKDKLVFIYQEKKKIYTYQTIELDKKNKLFLLGLLRNSQEKNLIGTYTVFNSIKFFKKLKNLDTLYTKSSKFNKIVNNLNKNIGMKIIRTGINFEFFIKS